MEWGEEKDRSREQKRGQPYYICHQTNKVWEENVRGAIPGLHADFKSNI